MRDDTSAIYNILLAQDYGLKLFGPGKKEGKDTITGCSFCKRKRFSYSQEKPVWHCHNCDRGGDWISYLMEAKGMDFKEALQLLADEAGYQLDGVDQERYQDQKTQRELLEFAQEIFHKALFLQEGDKTLRYLLDRGYSIEEIQEMRLGAYVDRDGIKKTLLAEGYSEDQIRKTVLSKKEFGETHTLSFLWPDASGRPLGFICRATDPLEVLKEKNPEAKKVYNTPGMKVSHGLLGFEMARGKKTVLLVEGPLDALYLNAKGLSLPVVAIGGPSISKENLESLKESKIEELLLALDMDEAGQTAIDRAIQKIDKQLFRVYVVSLPDGFKDPDELVRREGLEPLEKALKEAESWPGWKAQYLLFQHDLDTPRGRDMAVRGISSAWRETVDLIDRADMKRAFLRAYTAATGEDKDAIEQRLNLLEKETSKDEQKALLSLISSGINQSLQTSDISRAQEELEGGLERLRRAQGVEAPRPYLLEDFEQDILASAEGLSSGYPSLDKWAKIPAGALTIVAGRPGQGKTSFMLNLLRNQLEMDSSGRRFYFYSYEVARRYLALRLLMLTAEEVLNEGSNEGAYINYIKTKRGTNKAIEKALERFGEWTSSGRLVISDKPFRAEDLSATIGKLAQQGDTGAVFIDYIQKIPSTGSSEAQRYLQVARASQLLLEQAVRQDIPIILGAQLNRTAGDFPTLGSMRESGDIEQDAHLVLALQNDALKKQEADGFRVTEKKVGLNVSILKNRNGMSGGSVSLEFERAILKIRDPNNMETPF